MATDRADLADSLSSLAFRAAEDGMAILDVPDARVVEVNDAFLRAVGKARAEVLGSSAVDLGLWGDVEGARTGRGRLVDGDRVAPFTARLDTPQGQLRVLRLSMTPFAANGRRLMLVRAEEIGEPDEAGPGSLEPDETEVAYRALVERVPAITYTKVADENSPTGFHDVFVSPQTIAMLGYTPEDWKADPGLWLRTIHPEDRERVLEEEVRTGQQGERFLCEYRMIGRDGREVWFRDEALPLADPRTDRQLWLGVMLDITQEKQAIEQLRETERRYQSLVESLPAVVFIDSLDEHATPIYTSPQVAKVIGYTAEEWADDPELWSRMIHPEDRDRVLEANQRQIETSGTFDEEYRVITRDGRTIWIDDVSVVVRDEAGAPLYAQGFFIDITQRKEAERALQEALGREHETAERLRALDEVKNTLLHAVSHDVRNPLTTILGVSKTLQNPLLPLTEAERLELLRSIEVSSEKIHKLLSDLVDLDRLDRGIEGIERRPTEVGALVRRMVEEWQPTVEHPVEADISERTIALDAAKVERIVENLLMNVDRHTQPHARVWVKVTALREGVLLAIDDEGPGVADELKESIFEAFRRGTDRSPGTGIGLSLVQRFARLHGGRAWVEDRPGGGASFRVFLPDVGADERQISGELGRS